MVKASETARKAIENSYTGLCDITEYQSVKNEKSGITRQKAVTVVKEEPCRLSFEKITSAVQTDTGNAVSQGVKLFIAPELEIKNGSKVSVTQNNKTVEYAASGQAAVYASHQEIMLEVWKGWA